MSIHRPQKKNKEVNMPEDTNMRVFPHTSPSLIVSTNIIVVGSSAAVLDKELGSKIDEFDEVVRFNRAPTEGYEKYVGSKTTIRVANPSVFDNTVFRGWNDYVQPQFFIKEQKNQRIVLVGPDTNRRANQFGQTPNMVNDTCQAFLINYGKTRQRCSIGFIFLILCVDCGIVPYIYGFGLDEGKNAGHYWENKPKDAVSHKYIEERKELQDNIAKGRIKLL